MKAVNERGRLSGGLERENIYSEFRANLFSGSKVGSSGGVGLGGMHPLTHLISMNFSFHGRKTDKCE
jgi:hypothetical protein